MMKTEIYDSIINL